MIPDIETLIVGHLQADAAMDAIVNNRIVGTTPSNTASPWVRFTQLDAADQPNSQAEHLISYLVQLDAYAGTANLRSDASLLARTLRSSLVAMPEHVFADAVVTSVRILSMPRSPDADLEPARERYILTAEVAAHGV